MWYTHQVYSAGIGLAVRYPFAYHTSAVGHVTRCGFQGSRSVVRLGDLMKSRWTVLLCCFLSLVFLAGCSLVVRQAVVKGRLADLRNSPRIDPNDPNGLIDTVDVEGDTTSIVIKEGRMDIALEGSPCRVKYMERSGADLDNGITLEGELAGSSRSYPVRIDTGVPGYLLVNEIHVRENNLPIYHTPGSQEGICHLPDLRIGGLTLSNFLAIFKLRHSELQLFGLPIRKDKTIYIGVSLLQQFKYVAFDGINDEVEFSVTKRFEMEDQSLWSHYRFSAKPDANGRPRISIQIPIGGQEMTLVFDTGCQPALVTTEKIWEQTRKRFRKIRKSIKTGYAPLAGGNLRSRTVIVKELDIGNRVVKKAYVGILPKDNSVFAGFTGQDGILGMQCFADTTIVLDFEREVMWVKNTDAQ